MGEKDRDLRQFTRTTEAWYYRGPGTLVRDAVDEVFVGVYHDGGGTSGEFAFRWYDLGGEPTCRVEVFRDSWQVFAERFPDLIEALGGLAVAPVSPGDLTAALLRLGIGDETKREPPAAAEPPEGAPAAYIAALERVAVAAENATAKSSVASREELAEAIEALQPFHPVLYREGS